MTKSRYHWAASSLIRHQSQARSTCCGGSGSHCAAGRSVNWGRESVRIAMPVIAHSTNLRQKKRRAYRRRRLPQSSHTVKCQACKRVVLRDAFSQHQCRKQSRRNHASLPEYQETYKRLAPSVMGKIRPRRRAHRRRGRSTQKEKMGPTYVGPLKNGEDTRVNIVGKTDGLLFRIEPTVGGDGAPRFSKASISVVIEKSVIQSRLSLTALRLVGEAESFSVRSPGSGPLPILLKQRKPRKARVSFLPSREGEFNATLELDFRDEAQADNATPDAFTITRRLHGIAAVPQPQVTDPVRGDAGSRGGKKRTESKQSKRREEKDQLAAPSSSSQAT
ncbi:hypothetical protein BC834DRAFT_908569 [Gloeopeniophorella convolvens]|nr:hypothetical protein BC834DRAFT_908569 [Gloeopeniophorella convolvens]